MSKSEPHDIITRMRRGISVEEHEAVRLVEWIVHETQGILARVLALEGTDINHDALHGRCAFSQCVTSNALIDRGLQPAPFSTQSLRGYQVVHALLVLPLETKSGEALYLIDPTYRQFYDPKKPVSKDGAQPPGFILEHEEGGANIVYSLIGNGYIKINADIAHKYLASFCGGKSPFETPEKSMKWLQAGEYQEPLDALTRETMKRRGLLIASPAF